MENNNFLGIQIFEWIKLVLNPILFSSGAFFFNSLLKSRERSERNRDYYQKYIDLVTQISLKHDLEEIHASEKSKAVITALSARTLATLRELDKTHKVLLMRFLGDSGAIKYIPLTGANLSELDLSGLRLRGAQLVEVNLERALLKDTDLPAAHLNNARLSKAKFIYSHLDGANLSGADISCTLFEGVSLYKTILPSEGGYGKFKNVNLDELFFDSEEDMAMKIMFDSHIFASKKELSEN